MTEWTIVTVIFTMTGFLFAIVKPIINLNTSITKLTVAVGTLQEDLADFASKNADSHARMWRRSECQDSVMADHEARLRLIEKK